MKTSSILRGSLSVMGLFFLVANVHGNAYTPSQPPTQGQPCADPCKCGGATDHPVVFYSGAKQFEEVIADLPGPYESLRLSALYLSQSGSGGIFGDRWFLNWERSISVQEQWSGAPGQITIYGPGSSVTYTRTTEWASYGFTATATFMSNDGWSNTMSVSIMPGSGTNWVTSIARQLSCGSTENYNGSDDALLLTSYTDRGGNSLQFQYDSSRKITAIIDGLGRTNTITYTGVIANSISDWSGRTWDFSYDVSSEMLTNIHYPATPDFSTGYQKYFSYTNASDIHLVTGVAWNTDPPYMTVAYDGSKRVLAETFALGSSNTFNYGYSNGNSVSVIYVDGSQETYQYDTTTRLIQHQQIRQLSTCPEGSWGLTTARWNILPNSQGQPTNITSSVGLTETDTYNNWGGPLNRTQTDNINTKSWTYSYDENGCGRSISTITDPLGNTTTITYEFDQSGTLGRALPTLITQPPVTNALTGNLGTPTTSLSYDGIGRVTNLVDASSRTLSFTYAAGKSYPVTAAITAGGSNLTYQLGYDSLDRLTQIVTPAGLTNSFAYDLLGRLTNSTSSFSSLPTLGLAHDQWDNITAATFAPGSLGGAGGSLQSVYDVMGALTAVTNQLGNSTTLTYNGQRMVSHINRPLTRRDNFSYRADGILYAATNALTNVTNYCYDQFGRLWKVHDAKGQEYTLLYDAWNRLRKLMYADGTFDAYGYDGLDHVTVWTNRANQVTTYQYDALGRLTQENRPEGTWKYQYLLTGELKNVLFNGSTTSSYAYNALGQLTNQTEYGRSLGYSYDQQGRRSTVTYPDGGQISEFRDLAGRLTSITADGGQRYRRQFDGMGRIYVERWFVNKVIKASYYDAAGQLTNWTVTTTGGWTRTNSLAYDAGSRIATQALNGAMTDTRAYSYDLTDQLLSSTGSYSYSATYDALGNRLTADGGTYTLSNGGSLNQYGSITGFGSLTYDSNGNLSSWGTTNFWHDSQGQLTNLYNGANYSFSNDYRRLRVSENSKTFTYDAAGNLRQMTDGANTNDYVYADGIDHAVLLRRNGTLYALVTDHLGSVVAIVDSSGNLVETYDYTPFGKTTVTGTDVGSALGFTGREYDSATGLYYYRHRWYSPELGRFLETDPIGLDAEDINLYRYVGNDPSDWIDPEGLSGDTYVPDPAKHGGPHIDRYGKGQNVGRYRPDGTGIPHKGVQPPKIPKSDLKKFGDACKKLLKQAGETPNAGTFVPPPEEIEKMQSALHELFPNLVPPVPEGGYHSYGDIGKP